MKKLLFGIAVALLAFTIAELGLRTGSRIDLKLNLERGSVYKVLISREGKFSRTVFGEKKDSDFSCRWEYSFATDSGSTAGEIIFRGKGYSGSWSGAGGGMPYAALKKAWPDTAACRKLLIGNQAELAGLALPAVLTPWEESRSDRSVKRSLALIAEVPEPKDSLMGILIELAFDSGRSDSIFGRQKLERMIDRLQNIFPEKPVRIGDTWSGRLETSGAYSAVLEDSLKLTDRKAGVATLELRSMIKSNPAALPVDSAGLKLRLLFSGDQRGTLLLDEKTGLLNEGRLEQHFSGEIVLSGLAEYPDGITIPVQIEQKVKIEAEVNPLEDRASTVPARDSSGAGNMLPEKPSRSRK